MVVRKVGGLVYFLVFMLAALVQAMAALPGLAAAAYAAVLV
jgi:hypothetical protein